MRLGTIISRVLTIVCVCALVPRTFSQITGQDQRIVIAASVVLDGKGLMLHDTRVVVEGGKIVCD